MKKLLIFSLLSVAFNAMAEDFYLYWMIPEAAEVWSIDEEVKTKLVDKAGKDGKLYAKIRAVDTAGQKADSYLNFYASPDSAQSYGTVFEFYPEMAASATFAGTFTSKTMPANMSYYIELYNDALAGDGSWIGQQLLTWDDTMVTAGGMAVPPNWASVSTFTAAPEPTSGLLMLVGLAGLALRRKNKRA